MFGRKRLLLMTAFAGMLLAAGLGPEDRAAAQVRQRRVSMATEGQDGPGKRVVIDVDGPGSRGYLGVNLQDVNAENKAQLGMTREEGALVQEVEKESPAGLAGVQKGDVIVSYAGFPVFSAAQLARCVSETPVGRKVEVSVLRAGKRVSLEAQIAARSEPAEVAALELPRRPAAPNRRFYNGEEGGGMFNFGPMLRQFRSESVERPRLGVSVVELGDQLAEKYALKGRQGVLVLSVSAASAAEKAGLKAGDILTEVDGSAVSDAEGLTRALRRASEGAAVELKGFRDGQAMSWKAQLDDAARKSSGTGNQVIL